jgi:hypothetical protein
MVACIVVSLSALTGSSGCVNLGGKSCTAIGCSDQATIDFQSTTGGWSPGMYELSVNGAGDAGDAGEQQCVLAIPDSPPPTSLLVATCTGNLGLSLEADSTCTTSQNGNAVGESCTPVPGHFHLTLTIAGTPVQFGLTLSRDGQQVFGTTVTPSYHDFQPNGPECGPPCRQASAQLSVAADPGPDR